MGYLSEKVYGVKRGLEDYPLDGSALLARAALLPPARSFADALRTAETSVIAEVKRSSPSAGPIADVDPARFAEACQAAGAAAISVLTEPKDFGGSLADLQAVHLATGVPVLRKDFLVHPAQLIEARVNGADAALLIAACLTGAELKVMLVAASDLGLGILLETHGREDLEEALATDAEVVGVNARDLESLAVDEARALALLREIPPDRVAVLESGISTRAQVERAAEAGASAVLVGEALVRAPDAGAKLREMLGGSR